MVSGSRTEPLGHEGGDPIEAGRAEALVAHDPEHEPVEFLLDDLELGDPGDQHGEVLRQRDPEDRFAIGRRDAVGLAALTQPETGVTVSV
jgi:hypothetical protein